MTLSVRNRKGISTYIAVLILIVIAVAAGLLIYAYTMGYLGVLSPNANKNHAMQIQSASVQNTQLHIYLKNIGSGSLSLAPPPTSNAHVYINDVPKDYTIAESAYQNELPELQTCTLSISTGVLDPAKSGTLNTIKVVANDGTIAQGNYELTYTGIGATTVSAPSFTPPSPAVVNTVEMLSTQVSGSSGTPTGSVTFQVSYNSGAYTAIGSPALDATGKASTSYVPTAAGQYAFRAVYNGDVNYATQTSAPSTTLMVTTMGSAVATVSAPTFSPPSPAVINTVETLSTQVSGSSGTPTGSVTFQVSFNSGAYSVIGSAGLDASSKASGSYTPTIAGSYTFRAVYNGDVNYAGGVIGPASTTLTVTAMGSAVATVSAPTFSPPSPAVVNTVETLSTQVSGSSGTPTGSVTFQVSFNSGAYSAISSVALSSGKASASYTPTAAGSYNFRAVYNGDVNYATQSSVPSSTLTVTTRGSAVATITAPTFTPASPVSVNTIETLDTTVSGSSGTPVGSVTFQVSFNSGAYSVIGSAGLDASGKASISYSPTAVGDYAFRAIYNGDINYSTQTSVPSSTLTVIAQGSAVATVSAPNFTPPSPVVVSTPETLSTQVSGSSGMPTGLVTFQVSFNSGAYTAIAPDVVLDASGKASTSYVPTTTGPYTFRAIYNGDINYAGGVISPASGTLSVTTMGSVTVTVAAPSFTPTGPVVVNTVETLSTQVSGSSGMPTGSVTFQVAFNSGSYSPIGSVGLDASGMASTSYTPTAVGSYIFRAAYNGDTKYSGKNSPASATLTVIATPMFNQLAITNYPTSVSAADDLRATITAYDQNGNVMTSFTGTVHFTSSDSKAVLPADYAFQAADNGVHQFIIALRTAGTQTFTVASGSISQQSNGINVTPGDLDSFTITGPASATAGTALSSGVVVTAYDPFGNVQTGYTGKVYFTSPDGLATLPYTSTSMYTFSVGDAGAHTFPGAGFILRMPGSSRITVTDGSVSAYMTITVNNPTTTNPHYTDSIAPTSTSTGTSTSYTFTITKQSSSPSSPAVNLGWAAIQVPADFTGITAPTVTASNSAAWTATLIGNTVIVHANAAAGALSSNSQTLTVRFSATPHTQGSYTFTTSVYAAIDGSGSGPGTNNGADPSVTVVGTAAKLVYTVGAGQAVAASSVSSIITVTRQDSSGNPTTTGSITVTLTTTAASTGKFYSNSAGTTQITQVTIAAGSSSASFYYKDTAVGTPTLTAASSPLTSATTTFTIGAVKNGGFETTASWTEGGGAEVHVQSGDSQGPHSGTGFAEIDTAVLTSNTNAYASVTQTGLALAVSSANAAGSFTTSVYNNGYLASTGYYSFQITITASNGQQLIYWWGSAPATPPSSTTNVKVINKGTIQGTFTVGQWVTFSTNLGSDWTGQGLSSSATISSLALQANGYYQSSTTKYGQELFLDDVQIV